MAVHKCSVVILGLTLFSAARLNSAYADGPPTTQPATQPTSQPLTDEQSQMKAAWDDLAKQDPFCSKALLDMSAKPDAAVVFLKENLKPLKLEQADLDQLLKQLGSDDEKVWKTAFEKMQYLDPRLAGSVDELLDEATEQPAHNRVIALLAGVDADKYKGQTVYMRNRTNDFAYFLVQSNNGSAMWGVKMRVSQLDVADGYSTNPQWQRADRAVVLLQHIGTPAAIAILKEMATGHPNALPTKLATLAVKSLTEPATQESHQLPGQ